MKVIELESLGNYKRKTIIFSILQSRKYRLHHRSLQESHRSRLYKSSYLVLETLLTQNKST